MLLFHTKVGQYTEEEFETAFKQFKATNKPFIFTYFKDAEFSTASANRKDLMSLLAFQEKLDGFGHFYTVYKNIDELKFKFNSQLDKLAANGFLEFNPSHDDAIAPGETHQQATLTGSGAIAQGPGAKAVGAYVGGNVKAGRDFIGRDKITTVISAGELEPLFERLLADVAKQALADRKGSAIQKVEELKAEVAKGEHADDNRLGRIVDGLVALVPGAVASVVNLFATPILSGLVGPVTRFVLDQLKNR